MKKIVASLIFLCVCYVGYAQATNKPKARVLEGTVAELMHHNADSSFVQGARIYLEGSAHYVQSDMNGHFALDIPPGAVTVKVELFGYRNKTVEVAADVTHLNVIVERNGGFMEDEGWLITVVGMTVVFSALLLLFALFKFLMPLVLNSLRARTKTEEPGGVVIPIKSGEISGEVASAISAALHLYFNEMHDEESGVLTIEKTVKNYSPWSSKIYMNYKMLRGPKSSKW